MEDVKAADSPGPSLRSPTLESRGVCECLAWAVLVDSGKLAGRRKLDINGCARDVSRRIGEASNPGAPQQSVDAPGHLAG